MQTCTTNSAAFLLIRSEQVCCIYLLLAVTMTLYGPAAGWGQDRWSVHCVAWVAGSLCAPTSPSMLFCIAVSHLDIDRSLLDLQQSSTVSRVEKALHNRRSRRFSRERWWALNLNLPWLVVLCEELLAFHLEACWTVTGQNTNVMFRGRPYIWCWFPRWQYMRIMVRDKQCNPTYAICISLRFVRVSGLEKCTSAVLWVSKRSQWEGRGM